MPITPPVIPPVDRVIINRIARTIVEIAHGFFDVFFRTFLESVFFFSSVIKYLECFSL